MKKKIIIRIILIILILWWMNIVFGFSGATGEESSGISLKIAKIFTSNENIITIVEKIIRKIAHLSEYAVGGMLFYGLFLTFNLDNKKQVIFSGALGAAYAITDEVHQLFVPGRSGQAIDVRN